MRCVCVAESAAQMSDDGILMLFYLKGETVELCKWTVDIGSLPSFQENASMPSQNGFYTGTSKACAFDDPHDGPTRLRIRRF
jgi:hypothetical protein